jgi:hypothetical protein
MCGADGDLARHAGEPSSRTGDGSIGYPASCGFPQGDDNCRDWISVQFCTQE